ncbi:MAG: glycosyltransferase family 2 protein [bacterium]|nr:glycosyltransferase family 2 protein [bacterium]
MKTRRLVSVIIPAFNEEENIKKVVKDTTGLKKYFSLETIVVSDGSTDKTAACAKQAGATKVISYSGNLGKGGAFRKGTENSSGEYIIQIDADYQFVPSEIPKLVEALNSGADVVLGTRYEKDSVREEESVNYIRRFGSYFLSFCTSVAAGLIITDVMAGFKGFRRNVLDKCQFTSNHFGYEAEISILSARNGFSVINIPVSYKRRISGKSNVNTFRDGIRVLTTIAKTGLSSRLLL